MIQIIKSLLGITLEPKANGYRPDPYDPRDLHFEQLQTKLGTVSSAGEDLRNFCSTVEDQRATSSCVTNAAVGALEILQAVQGDPAVDLARLFVYYNARVVINETTKDDGCHIRHAMASLSSMGVCPEDVWPFDDAKITVRPSWKAYKTSYVHRFEGYYRIDGTGEERIQKIEAALSAKHPVEFGVEIYKSFSYCTGPVPANAGIKRGRHAMLIVGFDRGSRTFIIRNSWGTNWGDGGYFYAPYSWLDQNSCKDVWVATKVQ
jgi:C1A family cysteine protease